MRYIDLSKIDEATPEVKKWIKGTRTRYNTLCGKSSHEDRAKYLDRSNYWNSFKSILLSIYGEKCWYSECSLEGSFGDVDHFRPKNRSTNENYEVILPDGYWWLAFRYQNYRLSCEKCNRNYGSGGKNDRFPLKPDTEPAVMPNDDDVPMLLDPCVREDAELVACDESGEIFALSNDEYQKQRIDISKEIYNWKLFNPARKEIRTRCKTALELFEMVYMAYPDNLEPAIKNIHSLTNERSPYSSFARQYIAEHIDGKPYEPILRQLLHAS